MPPIKPTLPGFSLTLLMTCCSLAVPFSSYAVVTHKAHHSARVGITTKAAHKKTKRIKKVSRHHSKKYAGPVIQCVIFARSASAVALQGNAKEWWHKATGLYERGNNPEPNSILSFPSIRRMPLGHVAVVRKIVNSRTIIIDQSHWGKNGIDRNVSVIDVSPNNTWTAVRVQNGINSYGSIYPTNGFIYPYSGEQVERERIQMAQGRHTPTVQVAELPTHKHKKRHVRTKHKK